MIELENENRAFAWANTFLRSLRQCGLRHCIISPGSRSTPLTMAAAANPGLQKQVVLDERSAAFLAMGIGKATGTPAALICTSGTAVANYFPAVIEARMSGVPLLLLTADRPPHLRHSGANQTIDQQRIFGNYPVFYHEMGEPVMKEEDFESLHGIARQAFNSARSQPGPAHLNFPFRKPLEPRAEYIRQAAEKNRSIEPDRPTPAIRPGHRLTFTDAEHQLIARAERPLIICGQLARKDAIHHIFEWAGRLRVPVLSEQGYPDLTPAIQGFEGFLRRPEHRKNLRPDLILRFGRQPASKSLQQAVKEWKGVSHLYFADIPPHADMARATTHTIEWSSRPLDGAAFEPLALSWLQQWQHVERAYCYESEQLLANCPSLTDGHIYHRLSGAVPKSWFLFFSNSFPVRDRSMFGRWNENTVFTNRGASGIDGIISTAMGINMGLNRPGAAFIGDLAFLHDSNALLNHRQLKQPLLLVVINNGGGSIFRMLPIAEHNEYFEPYFETPQQIDIQCLASAHEIPYQSVTDPDGLEQFDFKTYTEGGIHLLECKTDPDTSMNVRRTLWGI